MAAGSGPSHDQVMTSRAETYNYPAFSFGLEREAIECWLRDAPPLGGLAPPFELPDLEGRHHRLGDFDGWPVVVEFGSYTCPIFCGHIPAMEDVARDHPEAVCVVIYTREAHPGEVRGAHRAVADKHAAARLLATTEAIGRMILVDDLDGSVHRAYGTAWNTAFVLDGQGRVVLRRAWNDPEQIGVALDGLLRGSVEPYQSVEMCPPHSTDGFGHGLLRGGQSAVVDFYRSAPPPLRHLLETSQSEQVRAAVSGRDRLVAGHPGTHSTDVVARSRP